MRRNATANTGGSRGQVQDRETAWVGNIGFAGRIWHHAAQVWFAEPEPSGLAWSVACAGVPHSLMADTYLSLRVHLVWATKNRRPWLDPEWRPRLYACAGKIVDRKGGKLLCAG